MKNKHIEIELSIDDRVHLGDKIKIIFVGQSGNQTRLGIQAPRDITVDREEIHEKRIKNT